jgi:hypothetical protein
MLENGADLNTTEGYCESALQKAASGGHLEVENTSDVKLLCSGSISWLFGSCQVAAGEWSLEVQSFYTNHPRTCFSIGSIQWSFGTCQAATGPWSQCECEK